MTDLKSAASVWAAWARRAMAALWIAGSVLAWPSLSAGQQTDALTRMLAEGRNFRVRTRAALALGRSGELSHAQSLERALLRDRHPAVRMAAADALAQLGCPSSRSALQTASRDRDARVRRAAQSALVRLAAERTRGSNAIASQPTADPPTGVDWARARYAVVVGDVRNGSGFLGDSLTARVRRAMAAQLAQRRDIVVVVPGGALAAEAARRKLPSFRIEANVTAVHRQLVGATLQVRCEVSVLLLDEPGRAMRSVMRGSATGMEALASGRNAQERKLANKAADGAIRSALDNAWRALDAASESGPQMARLGHR